MIFFREKCQISAQPLQCTSKGRESLCHPDRTDSNPGPTLLKQLRNYSETAGELRDVKEKLKIRLHESKKLNKALITLKVPSILKILILEMIGSGVLRYFIKLIL